MTWLRHWQKDSDLAGSAYSYIVAMKRILQQIVDAPATLRVLFVIGNPSAVVPLHWTTVPFSLAVALNVRVEVTSDRVVLIRGTWLELFVRVATNSKSSYCTDATVLQFK